jgi:thioester reductase-like protein
MSSYGIGQDFVNSRIVAIPGDLSAPSLGLEPAELRRLADLIDFVVHNGAWVNAAHTYNTLKQVNVDGTQELLRFASLGAPKPIHYVSTFNTVLTQTQYPDLANQTQCQEYFETLHTGYARSKWVAEMLLQTAQTRGLSTTIYRLPLIGAARCTGASNSNDLVSRFIDQCHQLGCIPEMKSDVNVIPVDDLADTFVAVALRGLQGIRYNIVNDTSLSMKRLIERMKTLSEGELKSVPGKEWLRHCAQSADGTVLATTLQNAGIASGAPDWAVSAQRCDTEAVLKVMHSPIDDEYLDRYLLGRMGNDEHQHLVATVNG